MFRASLAAAVLGGALTIVGSAGASADSQPRLLPAQWGYSGPPAGYWDPETDAHCRQLRQQARELRYLRHDAPPWKYDDLRAMRRETHRRLRDYCPGY